MSKDINNKPYDEATLTKLELIKRYLEAWLAIFFIRETSEIQLYDFFAGSGSDSEGTNGSPLIMLELISSYCEKITDNNSNVIINLNEYKKKKFKILNSENEKFIENCKANKCNLNNQSCPFQINIYNEDFKILFTSLKDQFQNMTLPRFILIDQYGIKHVTPEIFQELISINMSDIMFFISSSYIKRFSEQPEFQKYLKAENISFDETKFCHSHRVIFDYYKRMIPIGKNYYLGQFSIKKNGNYYGLIFGSNHPLGLEKFLESAWKIDPFTGDANFDIDEDQIRAGVMSIFPQDNIPKKLSVYQDNLLDWFENGGRTNKETYLFSLEHGIAKSKTNNILKELEKEGKITVDADSFKRRKGSFYLKYNPDKMIRIKRL